MGKNNNKYWTAKLDSEHSVVLTWGRVGAYPTSKTKAFSEAGKAAAYYEMKLREKRGKGYTPQHVVYDAGVSSLRAGTAGAAVSLDIVSRDLLGSAAVDATAAPQLLPSLGAANTAAAIVVDGPASVPVPPDAALERLVRALVAQNAHDITEATGGAVAVSLTDGLARTPLGVITEDAVAAARALLDRAAPRVVAGDLGDDAAWSTLLNEYLAAVPRAVGSRQPTARALFPNLAALQKEHALLDSLAGSLTVLAARRAAAAADAAATTGAPRAKIFDVALRVVAVGELEDAAAPSWANVQRSVHFGLASGGNEPVAAPSRDVFRSVRLLFHATARRGHPSHGLRLRQLYHIDIRRMSRDFEARGAPLGNVWRLWHGTRAGNLLSIFRSGLVVPPASSPHVTGRMFGDGIYGSDCSTKALNYSFGAAPGQRGSSSRGKDSCFAFLADFAMGRVCEPVCGQSEVLHRADFNSTWARASKAGLCNDEMIAYDAAQVRPVFLAEFEWAEKTAAN